ncbi:MAG: glycosyltransferase [Opitutaceae bacterium]|nr:glycosyltransferase [Opitutaceae bacterium]
MTTHHQIKMQNGCPCDGRERGRQSCPKVSVLIPVYNTNLTHLREAIDSILGQTFTDFELIILNDSPDNAELESMILSYKDTRIVYNKNEHNLGISPSRNKLMEMARGEYLAVFDHDDVSAPDRLELEANYLDAHPSVGVVSGQYQTFGIKSKPPSRNPVDDLDIKINLTYGCAVFHTAAMIRKSILTKYGLGYEEKFSPAEDYRLFTRLMDFTEFHNIDKVLVQYRWHGANTSRHKRVMENASDGIRMSVRMRYPLLASEEKKRRGWRIKLFGIIPVLYIKKHRGSKFWAKLFNVVPILTWRDR